MEHAEELLKSLVLLFVLGVSTQWIAWRIKVPAILLLLAVGSIAGSFLRYVQPQQIFGDLLLPVVSLSVGIILFEGGLNLRFSELKTTWRSLVGLLTIGVIVTWALVTVAAVTILQMPISVALLLGSILVVTGPTVIGPLIRDIRPSGRVGVIAKWEGIVIDPIGASLAVLVFNAMVPLSSGQVDDAIWNSFLDILRTLAAGAVCGLVPALLLAWLVRSFLIPDYLQNPMTLMLVLSSFALANSFQAEAGLLAVTVMGITLANYKHIDVSKIIEFKESIATLLIATLFIILSARVPIDALLELGWRGPAFALALILIVRPACVWLSTIRSGLNFSERSFLAWFAPRGIVAAAVSSVFALRLEDAGEMMVPATFWVIFTTVCVYGLSAPLVARKLGLATADAQGLLIAGANKTVREIGKTLKGIGFKVTMVDTQFPRIRRATQAGLNGCFANILSEEVLDLVDFGGVGKFLAMTANDQVNTLATLRFREMFGRSNVYQLKSNEVRPSYLETRWQNHMAGRPLFSSDLTFEKLDNLIANGAKLLILTADSFANWTSAYENDTKSQKSLAEDHFTKSEPALPTPTNSSTSKPASSDEASATMKSSQALPAQTIAKPETPVATEADPDTIARPKSNPRPELWPLFIVDGKRLIVCTSEGKISFKPGQKVIALSAKDINLDELGLIRAAAM